jgi:hypothetical protein
MSYEIPGTSEILNRNIANIEQELNEKSPPADRSFNKAWSVVEGVAASGLYAFAADRAKENLAISASADGLSVLGDEYGLPRRPATEWRGKISLSVTPGETLYSGTVYIGPQGIKYETTQAAVGEADGTAEAPLQCADTGPAGNLSVGDTLTIQSVIAGVGREAVVTGVTYLGLDIENVEDYRNRILDAERGGSGGRGVFAEEGGTVDAQIDACVTASDYRIAAEAVAGVARAYPFSGPPEDSGISPVPGQRTVYVEAAADIDPDGIPPQALLDLVRAALITDPATDASREILGVPTGHDLLFVEPIRRTGIYVNVIGLQVISSTLVAAETGIAEAVTALLRSFAPFVQGLDADFERRDELTASILTREIQSVLDTFGGSAELVNFGDTPVTNTARYILSENEKLKLAEINFTEAV